MQLTRFGRTGMPVSRCVPRHCDVQQANGRTRVAPDTRQGGGRRHQLHRHRQLLSYGSRAGAGRELRRDHRTMAQGEAGPLHPRNKGRGAHGPVAVGPGLITQAFARCNRRFAAPPWHRLRFLLVGRSSAANRAVSRFQAPDDVSDKFARCCDVGRVRSRDALLFRERARTKASVGPTGGGVSPQ